MMKDIFFRWSIIDQQLLSIKSNDTTSKFWMHRLILPDIATFRCFETNERLKRTFRPFPVLLADMDPALIASS